jgi:DNA adenine methylase
MILNRLGNKKRMAVDLIQYFPKHNTFIEPFFGAGGMFFSKPKAKYNFVNDIDSEVFNLYQVVKNKKEDLKVEFYKMPIHSDLLNYWKINNEIDEVQKAIRFLLLSNLTYMGTGSQLKMCTSDAKQNVLDFIDKTNEKIYDVFFDNDDFEKFINKISFRVRENDKQNSFIYCDPPYLDTTDNYSNSFTKEDSNRLFDCLVNAGCKFSVSEFDHPYILEQAKNRNLNVIYIGERKNIGNRRTEILITNYEKQKGLFD